MMYRTHCQRMLDTVISANFEGVNVVRHHNFFDLLEMHWCTRAVDCSPSLPYPSPPHYSSLTVPPFPFTPLLNKKKENEHLVKGF